MTATLAIGIGIVVLLILTFILASSLGFGDHPLAFLCLIIAILGGFMFFILGTVIPVQNKITQIDKPIIYTLPDRKIIKYNGTEKTFKTMQEYTDISDSTCTFYLIEYYNMYNCKTDQSNIIYLKN